MAELYFQVVGTLWSGSRSGYQYAMPAVPDEPMTPLEARCMRDDIIRGARLNEGPHMGDFQDIEDVRIVLVTTELQHGRTKRQVVTAQTLAGFRYDGSSRAYARACLH